MGVVVAWIGLLLDAAASLEAFVHVFISIYILVLLAYILTSWIRPTYSLTFDRIRGFLAEVSEPYLRIFRRILPPIGPLDLSPILGILVLVVVDRAAGALIDAVL